MAQKQKPKPKRGVSARTTALAALLAVVAAVAIWLSNCIPGFGFGSAGDVEGDAEKAEPAQPEAQEVTPPEPEPEPEPETAAANKTLKITIDVHGCSIDGAPATDCATICERAELFEAVDDAILDVEQASHGSVIAMTDCLKSKGIDKVAINRE